MPRTLRSGSEGERVREGPRTKRPWPRGAVWVTLRPTESHSSNLGGCSGPHDHLPALCIEASRPAQLSRGVRPQRASAAAHREVR
jgi:hypothetical protein